MEYLVSKGAPREKLLVGIPFYGQSYTLSMAGSFDVGVAAGGPGEPGEYTKQPGMLAYYEICHRVKNQKWNSRRDISGPYAYNRNQWVSYDDTESIKAKVSLQ